MNDAVEMQPVDAPVLGSIRPPGSKSLTNRALIVAALAGLSSSGGSGCRLTGVLDSVDTRVMVESLRRLGWSIQQDVAAGTIIISGETSCVARPDRGPYELWLENSGTSIRFLTALAAVLDRDVTVRLDGNERMRERPIAPLVGALSEWGADIVTELPTGCPPVRLTARGLRGGEVRVAGDLSSQYLSALLMAAPCADGDVTVRVEGPLVSRPYIDMTLAVMRDFGAEVSESEENCFVVASSGYKPTEYDIEPDASAASYFFAVAAVTGGSVEVQGLSRQSLQGDIHFVDALEQMGCGVEWREHSVVVTGGHLRGVDIDMNAISDTAQTLAVVAAFADGPTRIRGVAHMRHKETDRVSAVVTELRKLGLEVEEFDDGMLIQPGPIRPTSIATYDDHRMAMSFAVLGLKQPGIIIEDPGCTAKTYPEFFADLAKLCEATN
ncbi:MAG: 3-phosphoshikimate 1-carboxyvinyltransferase [Planctomycetaceae bacterium]